jgi:formylglycine-generating enzyme
MTRRRFALARWALAFLIAGCAGKSADPRAQWVVRLHTDARVPELGDRVFVQVLNDEATVTCDSCERLLPGATDEWPRTFGLVAAPGFAPRLRVRLLRAALLGGAGEPEGNLLIDRVVLLPATEDKTTVDVILSMSCFGIPADVAGRESCDPETGALAPDRTATSLPASELPSVASWPPSIERPCNSSEPEGMVCVPGGAFLLGAIDGIGVEPMLDTTPERLVRLDPFFLDRDELTVGEARQILAQDPNLPLPITFDPQKPQSDHCTFLALDDAANDALPLNCIPRFLAEELCEHVEKRLPTEAEWEFAAGNRSEESRYPWGEDSDVCGHAIVSRSFFDYRECITDSVPPGLVAGGSAADVTRLGILNLGGNLAEWVADEVAAFDTACWHPETTLLENPMCTSAQAGPFVFGFRGGFWAGTSFLSRATTR